VFCYQRLVLCKSTTETTGRDYRHRLIIVKKKCFWNKNIKTFFYISIKIWKKHRIESMINISCIICKFCNLKLDAALLGPCPRCIQENVIACKSTITSPTQSHLGRVRRYLSRQRMDSPASCATSCTISTADESNSSATCIYATSTGQCHMRPIRYTVVAVRSPLCHPPHPPKKKFANFLTREINLQRSNWNNEKMKIACNYIAFKARMFGLFVSVCLAQNYC